MFKGRVLGIDFGLKNVGVALGNIETKIATPFSVLKNNGNPELLFEISKIAQDWDVSTIVFGLPLNMKKDQKANEVYDLLMNFVNFLKSKTDFQVEFYDERLSTFEARDLLSKEKLNYKDIKIRKDSVSAQIILDKWLNSK
jgi:putative Holliday junction resolvase